MIFSVSYDGIEWSLEFGPDSVTLTVKDLAQEMPITSEETPLAAWSLLLSQRQRFLDNHSARVPVTPNQQGTHDVRDEVLSSVGAQEGLDSSGYQVSADLDDFSTGKTMSWMWTLFLDQASILLFHQHRLTTWRWEEVRQKTPICSTKRKTRRTLLLLQHHRSLRDQQGPRIAEKSSVWNMNRKCS